MVMINDELNLSITERRRQDHSGVGRRSMRFGRQSETKLMEECVKKILHHKVIC